MRHFRMGFVGVWSLVCVWSGAWAWQIDINGTANRADQARAVAVDGAGDVVAAGWTDNKGTINDFTVVKVAGDAGAERWRVVIAGTEPGTQNRRADQAIAVAVDAAGDVVAVGSTANAAFGVVDFTVVKLAGANGAELWRYVFPAGLSGQTNAVAVDAAGDVVAAGLSSNSPSAYDFTVVKIAGSSGAELWRYILNPANEIDEAQAVTVDSAGDVVAVGTIQTTDTGSDFTVVKLAGGSGAELWRTILNGPANSSDEAFAVAVDAAGDVLAAGLTSNSATEVDGFVVKLAGASGTEQWRAVINGTAGGDDRAAAVAVDGAGDVVAAGATFNADTGLDFTVVKWSGGSGAEQWRAVINGTINGEDHAEAVALDGAGDVVAAGFTGNSGTGADFTAVKLSGPSGAEQWRALVDGAGEGADQANAVAVDAAGDVVAAGGISNTGTPLLPRHDFTVVKLRGTDGGNF
jgi:hypothetical protein